MSDVIYTKKVEGKFDQIVEKLTNQIENTSFSVLHVHDIQALMTSKGFEQDPYKILEFCRAPVANKVLKNNPELGILLPCKAIVYENNGEVTVSLLSPKVVDKIFIDLPIDESIEKVDEDIKKIIDLI